MRGIRSRLILWNVLAIGLILAGMGLVLRLQLRANLVAQIDEELRQECAGVKTAHKNQSSPVPVGRPLLSDSSPFGNFDGPGTESKESTFVRLINKSADMVTLLADERLPKLIPVGTPEAAYFVHSAADSAGYRAAAAGNEVFRNFTSGTHLYRSFSEPVRHDGGPVLAVVQAIRDLAPVGTEIHRLDTALATLLPVALLIAALAGTFLVAGAMRPLRLLTESARTLKADKQLPVIGKDEFADLAVAFNEAFDRTATAFAKQERALRQLERFTGDAGHELRTPIGAIKGSATLMLSQPRLGPTVQRSAEIIDRACDRMTRLIGDLLLLARQDGAQEPPAMSPLNLAEVARRALSAVPFAVDVEVPSEFVVLGDEAAVERALANVLANAAAYSRSRVVLSAVRRDGWVEVRIEDDGEGIAPEHLPRIGERFYRPESARSRAAGGVGLGLSIVKGIMEAHGGSMEVGSKVGVGTTVLLRFPLEREIL